jgi:hypothetical protein
MLATVGDERLMTGMESAVVMRKDDGEGSCSGG